MEKGGASVSMDAAASMDMWDWEVLPDQLSSSSHGGGGHGRRVLGAQETEESNLDAAAADMAVDDECKDIGVDVAVPAETKTSQEETMAAKVTEEEEEEAFQGSDAKVVDGDDDGGGEEEEEEEEEGKKAGAECVVFRVGKLRVNGIGALCSFGVAAAATVCVFLVGGRLQHHHRQQQQHKIQLQLYGDDKVNLVTHFQSYVSTFYQIHHQSFSFVYGRLLFFLI
ncbi:Os07g0204100 [Oryza sativa Japonica Group]|jgi:hypothetical protein|uniref:Os07g0204100 protein n=1 Tax=Oryza sativa subsp. japonica TaxID=39947 RepID=Q0D7W7_ORYSJ|nr:Os07g0204100 [Oryza sativa Japonica Group]|eukprot:NP_001059142.2 Os07g0204100 [Oryza sativa Japonica Group]